MLGPSGSGKTTCLRLIAGFEQPTAGHIEIFGERAEGVPPYRRNVNTVFQDYALFPHLSVLDNVAYGLMVQGRRQGRAARKAAEEALALVKLPGYGARRPGQLSGGQRQRVALARALVNRPKVLLLDEPLGALDLKLREQMQVELKALQKPLGITFVFVTHDQGEALSMADRVAVFNDGQHRAGRHAARTSTSGPQTRFVADFVGSSNVLPPDFVAALFRPAPLGEPAARKRSAIGRDGDGEGVAGARRVAATISAPPRGCRRRRRRAAAARRSCRPAAPCPRRARRSCSPVQPRRPAPDGRAGMSMTPPCRARSRRAILPGSGGLRGALSDLFWRQPKLLLFLMLAPPLLWLGVVYLGSLFALLLQSFFSIDEFSGLIIHELTLEDLWRAAAAAPTSTSSCAP